MILLTIYDRLKTDKHSEFTQHMIELTSPNNLQLMFTHPDRLCEKYFENIFGPQNHSLMQKVKEGKRAKEGASKPACDTVWHTRANQAKSLLLWRYSMLTSMVLVSD